jgi:hypothetical protein
MFYLVCFNLPPAPPPSLNAAEFPDRQAYRESLRAGAESHYAPLLAPLVAELELIGWVVVAIHPLICRVLVEGDESLLSATEQIPSFQSISDHVPAELRG